VRRTGDGNVYWEPEEILRRVDLRKTRAKKGTGASMATRPRGKRFNLERIPQRKLQIARQPRLRRHLAERRSRRVQPRAAPVRMIVHVERFGAELQIVLLIQREFLIQPQIPVLEPRLINRIAHALLQVERPR